MSLHRIAQLVSEDAEVRAALGEALASTVPPAIDRALLAIAQERGEDTVKVYVGKIPKAKRQARDDRIRELLAEGVPAKAIPDQVACSLAHVYAVRRKAAK